eukprot:TRINITY_DN27989_c0_g1_i1.p1 TRINITY_DN27989_c0_g1~~TRINITY_DN27989_c0_g1_i1.p1  ORF type:complete len:795 (-),score=126.97 TRINITY_DN27989_c0_g1_i1:180-2564(-)
MSQVTRAPTVAEDGKLMKPEKGRRRKSTLTLAELKSFKTMKQTHGADMIRHRVFYWIWVKQGEDCRIMNPVDVTNLAGAPEHIVLNYWKTELSNENAIKSLPSALGLIFFYAMLMLSQQTPGPVHSVEQAITSDIYENANFAFSGHMGHKNIMDVNSYADFWSWLDLGFQAIYMSQLTPLSEASSLQSQPLEQKHANMMLWHHKKIGPVQLSKQVLQGGAACPNAEVAEALGLSCEKDGDLYLEVEPTRFAVENSNWVEDTSSTVLLRFSNATRRQLLLKHLEKSGWLDPKTYHVKVSFLTYSAHYDLLTSTSVHLLFARSGHIWKKITNQSATLKPYVVWHLPVFQVLFWGLIVIIFLFEVREIIQSLIRGLRHGHGFRHWFLQYGSVWNLVDWISIIFAFAIMGLWIQQALMQQDVQTKLLNYEAGTCWGLIEDACDDAFNELKTGMWKLGVVMRRSRIVVGFYPICIMLRLFKTFASQPRLAVVTRTMHSAAGDIFHFGIVFLSIFLSYAFMAQAFFGRDADEFATFGMSVVMLFRYLTGDFDTDPLFEIVGRPIGFLFFCSYMLLTVMLLLNMLIAIVMDVYGQSKAEALSSEPLWRDLYQMVRRAMEGLQGKRMPLEQAFEEYLEKWGDEVVNSDKLITPEDLMDSIPKLAEAQAYRAFHLSLTRWADSHKADVANTEVLTAINRLQTAENLDSVQQPDSHSATVKIQEENDAGIQELAVGAELEMQTGEFELDAAQLAKEKCLRSLVRAAQLRLAEEHMTNTDAKNAVSNLLSSTSYLLDNEAIVRVV